ncbi:MAG: prepilin-type N-terminal cleavage/methylation domain-containing protein [Gammaproteobacteria bacterium]|nr:MAG: prepilin-type N-terminal cleavage/methylation domain-containing protein [Gammaproteobacteria bacterium]
MVGTKRAQNGLTVIELMLTIAVAGVLLAMAVPVMRGFIMDNRLTAQANALVNAIKIARTEAVKRRVSMEVAPISGDWDNGWLVRDVAKTITVFNYEMAPGIEETGGGMPASIVFRPSGARSVLTPVVAKLCDDRKKGRRIEIRGLGITSVCWINYPGRAEACTSDNSCS